MRYHSVHTLSLLLCCAIACLFWGCSNSEWTDLTNKEEPIAEWEYPIIIEQDSQEVKESKNKENSGTSSNQNVSYSQAVNQSSSSSKITAYLPINDTEYPYAGIPRIVIETKNRQEIKDRETEIPAKLQIWGKTAPESEIMDLTIRGRGNTSWGMPKKSYKIEFIDKQSLLGMPKDRDWALIANYADKTLMKNFLAYHLSAQLGAYYAPRCEFAELYINKEYLGVYLLTETIKQAKNRVNIPEDNSYLVEVDVKYRETEQVVFSRIIRQDSIGKPFRIHYPKHASTQTLKVIEDHIKSFEIFLKDSTLTDRDFSQWIDIDEYIKHYWIQEFSKNPDATFHTSVFFSWSTHDVIKMGPVWDFDLAFGGHNSEKIYPAEEWHLKYPYWNEYIFKDSVMESNRVNYWIKNKDVFLTTLDIIDSVQKSLNDAAQNNFKRWNILQSTHFLYHRYSYRTHKEAADDLKKWIQERIQWIDSRIAQYKQ